MHASKFLTRDEPEETQSARLLLAHIVQADTILPIMFSCTERNQAPAKFPGEKGH
jgi:hypothetical protein